MHETQALDPIDITVIDGIPATTPERTLFDLGVVCGPLVVKMAELRDGGGAFCAALRALLRNAA